MRKWFVMMLAFVMTLAGCGAVSDFAKSIAAGETILANGKQWGADPMEKEWELNNGSGDILECFAENQAKEGALIVSLFCEGEEVEAQTLQPGESIIFTQELTEETKTYLWKAASEEGKRYVVSYKILQKSSERSD